MFTLRDLFWLILVVGVAFGGYDWGYRGGRESRESYYRSIVLGARVKAYTEGWQAGYQVCEFLHSLNGSCLPCPTPELPPCRPPRKPDAKPAPPAPKVVPRECPRQL